jgi:Leucine-rich repeat (LRR) protein
LARTICISKILTELNRENRQAVEVFSIDDINKRESLVIYHSNLKNIVKIEPASFQAFSQMKTLDLGVNQIREIALNGFEGLNNLVELNLKKNYFTLLDLNVFAHLNNLKKLNLSRNRLTQIYFHTNAGTRALLNLKELNLNSNRLMTIEPQMFAHLSNLKRLYLSHNHIVKIDSNGLQGLVNLEILNMKGNFLVSLKADILKNLDSLKEVDFSKWISFLFILISLYRLKRSFPDYITMILDSTILKFYIDGHSWDARNLLRILTG